MQKIKKMSRIIICVFFIEMIFCNLYSQVNIEVQFENAFKEATFIHDLYYIKDTCAIEFINKKGSYNFEISKNLTLFENDISQNLYKYKNIDSCIFFILMNQQTFFVIPIRISDFRNSNYLLRISISKTPKKDFALFILKKKHGISGLISFLIESNQYWMCINYPNSMFGCSDIYKYKKRELKNVINSIKNMQ